MITQPDFWWRGWAAGMAKVIGARLADIINVAPPEDDTIRDCIEHLIDVEQQLSTYESKKK